MNEGTHEPKTPSPLWPARCSVAPAIAVLVLLATLLLPSRMQAAEPETLTLPDGGKIEVLVALPPPTVKETMGLVLCLGGGPGDRGQAESTLSFFQGLVARGWVAVAPVSPDGKPLFGANGAKMPQLLELLQKRPGIPRGKVLLAGVSNGGIAAFEIAAMIPQQVLGVIALPGLLSPTTDLGAFRDMPVYLRLGAKDNLHWDELDPWLSGIRPKPTPAAARELG